MGTSVVAYDRGANRELIEEGVSGVLIDPDSDARTWVEAINSVMNFGTARVRQRAYNMFSPDAMAVKYLPYYARLLR